MTIHNPEEEHRDPALAALLGLIRRDIAAGRSLRDLPADLATALRKAIRDVAIDLDEPLEGDFSL